MDIETRLKNLENLVNYLSEKIDSYKFYFDADIAGDRQSISAITPYTETKTAYYGETHCIFYDVPQGNVSVFFDKPIGAYSISREENRLLVTFDAIKNQTQITISIQ